MGSSSSNSGSLKLLILVLSLFAVFGSSSAVWGIWLDPAIVRIQNDLRNGTLLNYHCKSKDDDLGRRVLEYEESWKWDFKINYSGTTLFWCNFRFKNETGKPVKGGYQVYKARRDVKRCGQMCDYSARLDGLYLSPHGRVWELVYAWPK